MLKALKKGKASSKPPGLQGAALRELIAPRLRLWLCAQVALKFELITRLELQHRLDSLGLSEDTEMKSGTTVATAIAQVQEWLDAELGFLTTASASGLISDKPLFAGKGGKSATGSTNASSAATPDPGSPPVGMNKEAAAALPPAPPLPPLPDVTTKLVTPHTWLPQALPHLSPEEEQAQKSSAAQRTAQMMLAPAAPTRARGASAQEVADAAAASKAAMPQGDTVVDAFIALEGALWAVGLINPFHIASQPVARFLLALSYRVAQRAESENSALDELTSLLIRSLMMSVERSLSAPKSLAGLTTEQHRALLATLVEAALFLEQGYDARVRGVVKLMALAMPVSMSLLQDLEDGVLDVFVMAMGEATVEGGSGTAGFASTADIGATMVASAPTSKQAAIASGGPSQASRSGAALEKETRSKRRGAKMVAGALFGGVLLAATGGLAAPLVAGAATAIGITATTGTVTVVTASVLGVIGGRQGTSAVRKITSGLKQYEYETIAPPGLGVRLAIGGWVNAWDKSVISAWEHSLPAVYGLHGHQVALVWESAHQRKLGEAIESFAKASATSVGANALMTGLTLLSPGSVVRLSSLIDNSWNMAVNRAHKASKLLMQDMKSNMFGRRPLQLIAVSVGARLVFEALTYLSKECVCHDKDRSGANEAGATARAMPFGVRAGEGCSKAIGATVCPGLQGIVENVVLIGTPITSGNDAWRPIRALTSGRVVNVYCPNDLVLAMAMRTAVAATVSGRDVGAGTRIVTPREITATGMYSEALEKARKDAAKAQPKSGGVSAGALEDALFESLPTTDLPKVKRSGSKKKGGSGRKSGSKRKGSKRRGPSNSEKSESSAGLAVPTLMTPGGVSKKGGSSMRLSRRGVSKDARISELVENVNASAIIDSHLSYQNPDVLTQILEHVNLDSPLPCPTSIPYRSAVTRGKVNKNAEPQLQALTSDVEAAISAAMDVDLFGSESKAPLSRVGGAGSGGGKKGGSRRKGGSSRRKAGKK